MTENKNGGDINLRSPFDQSYIMWSGDTYEQPDFFTLRRPWLEQALGTKEIIPVNMGSVRVANECFERDDSCVTSLCIQDFSPERSKAFFAHDGSYIHKETGIKLVSYGHGYAMRKDDVSKLIELIDGLRFDIPENDLNHFDRVSWDANTILFRRDFEFFVTKEDWFREREIDYTRAYLLYGPPGNGKTTTIKAVANSINAVIDSFDFANPMMGDEDFAEWLMNYDDEEGCLTLKVMEDLDRFFPMKGKPQTRVSLSAILNALDGAKPHHNTIIIATANHPENLDAQVLARPGRFDRKIFYSAPDQKRATDYLIRIFQKDKDVTEATLGRMAVLMKGQSYASLKEILKTSATVAFARLGEDEELKILDSDVETAVEQFLTAQKHEQEHLEQVAEEKRRKKEAKKKARKAARKKEVKQTKEAPEPVVMKEGLPPLHGEKPGATHW